MQQEIKERIELINKGIVPAGYKKTSVGICPIEWEVSIYNNLGKFSKGCGIPGYSMIDNGVPCVGYGDIYTKYNIKFNLAKCFTDEITAKESKKIPKDTLLFTGSGETAEEIGKCVCYYGNEDIYAGGDIILFNTEKVNPLFLSYQQNLWSFVKEKARLGQGHSVVHIYPDDISKLHAISPKTFVEQERIVEILDYATRQVELQEQLVDRLKVQKKAFMQKLLTPQPDWLEVKLGDICKITTGKLDANEMVEDGEYPFFTCSKDIYKIDKYAYDMEALLMAGNGEIGDIKYYNGKFNAYQRTYILYNFTFNIKYTMQYLLLHFNKAVCKGSQKSSMPYIRVDLLNNAKILYSQNLDQIAIFLENFDKKIELQQKLLWQYKLRQKALMQLLLTGIVRVG